MYRGAAVPGGVECFAVSYLATVRRDGGPRLHPFCPILAGGRLFAAIPHSSPKGWDLRRDPRCVIHALPGPEDDGFLRSRDRVRGDRHPPARVLVSAVVVPSGVGGMIESALRDPLFEFDLEQVDVARWLDIRPARHPGRPAMASRLNGPRTPKMTLARR